MYEYNMIIDHEPYSALFLDHFEAADFIADIENDGSEVIVLSYKAVSAFEILKDETLEWAYRVEMAAEVLLPNARTFEKWSEQEAELKRLGFIS